jgi:D-aminoacyl-tRNA deacylase
MRIIVQRVTEAEVKVSGKVNGAIKGGLLVLAGFEATDTDEDLNWTAKKLANMRIFNDEAGKMNLSVKAAGGNILVVSQFTLHASTQKGNRPSFIRSARPELAIPLYESFIKKLKTDYQLKVETGIFGAMMQVSLVNDGPVTVLLDSKNKEV